MRTIERNYRKNPHTANFLMTFHTAAYGLPSDVVAEEIDLLNEVPVEAPAYEPTPRQKQFITDLIREVKALNTGAAQLALDYTVQRTQTGTWTRERVSQWIERLIAKRDALRTAAAKPVTPSPIEVADGRYAVEEDGVLKFFKVKNGRRPGFVFLDIQASDDWFPIRVATRRVAILATIAQDPKAAMIRYGHELGVCGRCGRTLTDEASRAAGIGPVCIDK